MTDPARRRCVVCTCRRPEHYGRPLAELGYRPHAFDPGERREPARAWYDPLPRRTVWSDDRRRRFRAARRAPRR